MEVHVSTTTRATERTCRGASYVACAPAPRSRRRRRRRLLPPRMCECPLRRNILPSSHATAAVSGAALLCGTSGRLLLLALFLASALADLFAATGAHFVGRANVDGKVGCENCNEGSEDACTFEDTESLGPVRYIFERGVTATRDLAPGDVLIRSRT